MKNWQLFKKRSILAIMFSLFFLFSGTSSAQAKCVIDTSALDGCKSYSKSDCGVKKDDFSDKYCKYNDAEKKCVMQEFVNEAYCNGETESSCKQESVCTFENDIEATPAAAKDSPAESDKNAPKIVSLVNPISGNPSVQTIIGKVILQVMGILGALALLVFVYGGFKWLAAAGNEEHIKEGTQAMLWAVIGIFIIFGSYAIIRLIYTGLGIETGITEKKVGCMCFTEQSKDIELLKSEYIDAEICATAVGKEGGPNEGKIISCKFY